VIDHRIYWFVTGFKTIEMNFLTLARLIKTLEHIFRSAFFINTHLNSLLIRNASQMVGVIVTGIFMIVGVQYTNGR
jgi:hypothetical protein